MKIKKDFVPDVVFTPGLRGATFANLLVAEFNEEIPVVVGISIIKQDATVINLPNYHLIETTKWSVYIPEQLFAFSQKNILIVDDFAMSGDFLHNLSATLIARGFAKEHIRTMCVAVTKVAIKAHKAPDYYWFQAEEANFYFPWGKAK